MMALVTDSAQRRRNKPSANVETMPWSSLSQEERLMTLWVRLDPNMYAPHKRCMSAEVDRRWHCLRLLDKFSHSTMFKYIGTLQCVHNILLEFSLTWQAIGTYQLSDLLQITHEGRQTDWGFGASAAIKALRWLQKTLQIPAWSTLHGPVVNSFLAPKIHERKEAVPLSLFTITQWERRLLMKDCPLQDQVILGGFLCMLWEAKNNTWTLLRTKEKNMNKSRKNKGEPQKNQWKTKEGTMKNNGKPKTTLPAF